jgi:tetratricopeptide (TPR) repeat protein
MGRFLRRHRWTVAATAVAGVALLAASAYAIAQYGRAQRHLAQIQKTDRSNLREVYQEVTRLAGSAKARMLIVETTRRDLDALFRDEPSNTAVRRTLAESYLQLAQLQGEPFTLSLGETQAARESYRKALDLSSGSDWTSRAIGKRAQQGLIELLIRSGDYREAAREAQSALEPARRLWEESPLSARVAGRSLGQLYTRFHLLYGHALLRAADREHSLAGVDLALHQFQKTAAIAEQVRVRDPAEADLAGRYSQYIGYAYDLRSDYTGNPADAAAAVVAHRRTAASAEREFQQNPNPTTQRDLADALVYLGWSSCQAGTSAEGLPLLRRAVALMEPVAQADPQSREAALDLAVMYFRLGASEVHLHRFAEGLPHLSRAEKLTPLPQPVRREDRETAVLVSQLMEAKAHALAALGQKQAAAAALQSAVTAVSGVEVVPEWRRRQLETAWQDATRGIFPRP